MKNTQLLQEVVRVSSKETDISTKSWYKWCLELNQHMPLVSCGHKLGELRVQYYLSTQLTLNHMKKLNVWVSFSVVVRPKLIYSARTHMQQFKQA